MGEWNALGALYRADFGSGEIDTQEWLGKYPAVLNAFAKSNGIRAAAHNVNFLDSPPPCHQPVANFSRAYHVYGVNVFPDRMEWIIDGCIWGTTEKSTVDSTTWANLTQKDYFTEIALLIGGSKYWAGSWSDVPDGITMKVDRVRFFQVRVAHSGSPSRGKPRNPAVRQAVAQLAPPSRRSRCPRG